MVMTNHRRTRPVLAAATIGTLCVGLTAYRAETIGGYVIGRADGNYPGSRTVDKRALKKCIPLADKYIGASRSDLIAAANSTGRSGWTKGTTMTACFVEATKGTFTKPLKGIKNKPLSQYR